ncbi:MAG TPA: adenylyl-sulfate kinase [Lacunisphaera sp.]
MSLGHVFWFFGLSGSGKTTLTTGLESSLAETSLKVLRLDGDELRAGLCRDLGFTDEDRRENIRRAAEMAKLAMLQGQIVVAAFITPRKGLRDLACGIIGRSNLDFVWVDAPVAVCRQRDPKGLYRQSKSGDLIGFTGVDSVFEEPAECDFRVQTDRSTLEQSFEGVRKHCIARLQARGIRPVGRK